MPKRHPPYSPEFRRQMVELVRAGRSPEDLAREFELTAQLIGHWVAQADKQESRREEAAPGLTAAERDELARLRRELRQLRVERDILSKARPGLPGKPGRCRPGFPVHERGPGRVRNRRHGARARALRLRVRSACPRRAATLGCGVRHLPMPSRMRRC